MNTIFRDGMIISQQPSVLVLTPGADVSTMDQSVQDLANLVWTADIISAYKASLTTGII